MTYEPRPSQPFLRLSGGTGTSAQYLQELSELYDPQALMLPTTWNAQPSRSQLPSAPSPAFEAFAPEVWLQSDVVNEIAWVPPGPMPLAEVMQLSSQRQLWVPPPAKPLQGLPQRGAQVEVSPLGTLKSSAEHSRQWALAIPPVQDLWSPAQFHYTVTRYGPVGLPFLVKSTGNADMDTQLSQALKVEQKIRQLPVGSYLITIGP